MIKSEDNLGDDNSYGWILSSAPVHKMEVINLCHLHKNPIVLQHKQGVGTN